MGEVGLATVHSTDPDFMAKASKMNGVSAVMHDFRIKWIDPSQERQLKMKAAYGNPPASGDDDFFFDLQWGHDAIDAPEAWNAGYRGKGARVAVLDTGFDLSHPDLAPNIDLGAGKSFVPGEQLQYGYSDPFSHGTYTAGLVAAADNGLGTIGVAPEAKLILVKVLSDSGSGEFSWLMQGIVHAVNQHADVINMSLSGYFPKNGKFRDENGKVVYDDKAFQKLVVAINKVTNYANQHGATLIAAAGNSFLNSSKDKNYVVMPAEALHVIAIAATAPRGWALAPFTAFLDYPASYTNYGVPLVDLAAPGGDFIYPGDEFVTIGFVTAPAWLFDLVLSTGNNFSWYWAAGTSASAPYAAGVAALVVGKNGGSMKPAQVESALRMGAEDLGKPGRDPYYGHGRINAYQALTGKKVSRSAPKPKSIARK
ncbi:S8 family serine peptidase [Pontibacter sp. E15-1]|uniref:S8 family peptidase n=1 Tax=Pontibacter sp. E15-1 TaxID=2919918 RepID=UPI001F503930|nr:S8 family serine peptidase [Pontibacter sp. E15-1]MCJ8166277.1 S8 family serine peptidase [Pontibacter sp. E15-1]